MNTSTLFFFPSLCPKRYSLFQLRRVTIFGSVMLYVAKAIYMVGIGYVVNG